MPNLPLEAQVTVTPTVVSVTAAAGGAGQAVPAAVCSRVQIANGAVGGPIAFQVAGGGWTTLDRQQAIWLPINLASIPLMLRKDSPVAGGVAVTISVESVGQTQTVGGAAVPSSGFLLPSYLGPIGGRTGVPNTSTPGSNFQLMGQSQFVFTDYSTYIEPWFANWYVNGDTEVGTGQAASGRASLTYVNTWGNVVTTQLVGLSSGIALATCADLQNLKFAGNIDSMPFTRAKLRFWGNFPGGMPYCQYRADYTNGDIFRYGATTPDLTGTTTAFSDTYQGTLDMFQPVAILGNTTKRTLATWGDSRGVGIADVANDAYGFIGNMGRKFGPYMGINNVSNPGAQATGIAGVIASGGAARRIELARLCSDLMMGLGVNDTIAQGKAAALVKPALESIIANVARPALGMPINAWVTNGSTNTVYSPGNDAKRQELSGMYRAKLIAGLRGVYDHPAVLEAITTHILQSLTYTSDGCHETNIGNALAATNSPFDWSLLGNPQKFSVLASA